MDNDAAILKVFGYVSLTYLIVKIVPSHLCYDGPCIGDVHYYISFHHLNRAAVL